MNCPKCRAPIEPNTRYCSGCGNAIAASFEPAPIVAAPAAAGTASAAWPSSAHAAGLLTRIRNIVLAPKQEWPRIDAEPTTIAQLCSGYVLPLSLLTALLAFLRMSVIGVTVPFAGVPRLPMTTGLEYLVLALISGLIGSFFVALIINGLAPSFGGQRDQRQAMKVAAYALTPAWLSSVLALSPILPSLLQFLAGCYGIYVMALGLPVLMRNPRDRTVGYTATVVVCVLLLGIAFGIASAVVGHFGASGSVFGMNHQVTDSPAASRDRAAAQAANIVGNALGTDAQGKAGLATALSNLAKSGETLQNTEVTRTDTPSAAGTMPAAPPQNTDPSANPMAATAGLLTALGGALGGPNRVEPVDFNQLSAMLPSTVADMKRTHIKGEGKAAVGVKTTSAVANYANDSGAEMDLEIDDMSGVSSLMGLSKTLVESNTSQSDTGYEKNLTLAGRSAHETYDSRSKKGEINMLVANRFTVNVSGTGVDMPTLEQAYAQIDLDKLESLKNAGAVH
jgi:Yip1 domain